MAHVAFVRSPHAHARVLGVRGALLTAADLVGRAVPARVDAPPGLTVAHAAASAARGRRGAATSASLWRSWWARARAQAEDLAERVQVDYEPLPAVVDPRAGSELARWEKREGDVAGAFAAAAHVVRTDHVIPRLAATPMEPRGAIAAAGRAADGLVLLAERAPAAGAARADARPRPSRRSA